ncbi:MAG: hypothetical protein RIR07_432 [Bacteroidota bacterium]|jgi:hypothetical protein
MIRSLIFVLALALSFGSAWAQSFQERSTTAGQARITVTNVGTFGNAFRGYRDGTGMPSGEYPAGSGTEHLFESGIWVGGIDAGGGIRVSTSAYDAPQGYAPGRGGFEFTPASSLGETSSLKDHPNYRANAISHQDFRATCVDTNILIPGTTIPIANHLTPMGIAMTMSTYNWNYRFSDFFVVVDVTLKNVGIETYNDVYAALWANTVVRNINRTPAGSGGAVFYQQGGNGYVDSLQMAYCFDANGDPGWTDSYIGQKFLGAEDKFGVHHPEIDGLGDHYNAWVFNNSGQALFYFPTSDDQRYLKMSQGLNQDPCWANPSGAACAAGTGVNIQAQLNATGNRSDLVSVGPFQNFAPGDEITVAFAFVFAKKVDDGQSNAVNSPEQRSRLLANAQWAQTCYNGEDQNFNGILDPGEDRDGDGKITRYILPSPPDAPQVRALPGDGYVDLFWTDRSERSIDPISQREDFAGYRVYASQVGFDVDDAQRNEEDFRLYGEWDQAGDGVFFETGLDAVRLTEPVQFAGDSLTYRYGLRLENLPNGWQRALAVTAFDQGDPATQLESLESSFNQSSVRAFPGTPAQATMANNPPYVYPNPYYAGAAWEGTSSFQDESRRLMFANLPARAEIRVHSPAGDLLDVLHHDAGGSDQLGQRWFRTFADPTEQTVVLPGGEYAWDILSKDRQIVAHGLYRYTVLNLDTGESYSGHFTLIK